LIETTTTASTAINTFAKTSCLDRDEEEAATDIPSMNPLEGYEQWTETYWPEVDVVDLPVTQYGK